MKTGYLTDAAIFEMADAALTSYEWTVSWRKAGEAARELAADDFGIRATSAQIGLAVRLAQTRWQAIEFSVRGAA